MKAHHFILGNDKVTLWRNHVSELKEQISEIMRLMTMGDAGADAGEEEGRVNLWRSRRHDVFRAARDQKLPVCLSCRTENAAGQAEEQLLSAQVLCGDPLTLELLDAPPELLLASDFCSYTFTIQEEEARLEVSGTASRRPPGYCGAAASPERASRHRSACADRLFLSFLFTSCAGEFAAANASGAAGPAAADCGRRRRHAAPAYHVSHRRDFPAVSRQGCPVGAEF